MFCSRYEFFFRGMGSGGVGNWGVLGVYCLVIISCLRLLICLLVLSILIMYSLLGKCLVGKGVLFCKGVFLMIDFVVCMINICMFFWFKLVKD